MLNIIAQNNYPEVEGDWHTINVIDTDNNALILTELPTKQERLAQQSRSHSWCFNPLKSSVVNTSTASTGSHSVFFINYKDRPHQLDLYYKEGSLAKLTLLAIGDSKRATCTVDSEGVL